MDGYTPDQSRRLRALELAVSFAETSTSTERGIPISADTIVESAQAFDKFLRS